VLVQLFCLYLSMTQSRIRGYCIVGLLQAATGGITGLYPLYWHDELHLSVEQVGLINAWSGALSIAAPVAIGAFSGLFSPVRLIVLCGIMQAASIAASLIFNSFLAQIICYCCFQYSRWGLITLLPVVVINAMRGMPNSTFTRFQRAGNIGFLVSLIGLGNLSSYFGIFPVLACGVVASLLSIAPFYWKLPSGAATTTSDRADSSGLETAQSAPAATSFSVLLRDRSLLTLSGMLFFISIMNPLIFTFMPIRMTQMGANSGAVSNVIALCGVFALIGLPIIGRLLDRMSYLPILMVVPVLAAFRVVLLGMPSESYWWFGIQQLLHIPTSVVLELAMVQAVASSFSSESLPRVQGMINACALSGMAFGSFMAAQLLPTLSGDLQQLFFLFASLPLFAYPFVIVHCLSKKEWRSEQSFKADPVGVSAA
jgi:predicted MFS family arabinose efflux permease